MAAQQSLSTPFITRARHLSRLNERLVTALSGAGQVCFVTGEPGAGKTALVAEFTRASQLTNSDVVVAFGE